MSSGFGVPYIAQTRAALKQAATPPSGNSPEAIWHQVYDTQAYVSTTTTTLNFFQTTQADQTLSNMESAGVFPAPQIFKIYNITCDLLLTAGVSETATGAGNINDQYLLLFASGSRPIWTLTISNKNYGPYSLSALHGTGSLNAQVASTVATVSTQVGTNTPVPGWNYFGKIIIPEQNNFNIRLNWAAAQTIVSATPRIRISMFGVLSRRVL